VLGISRKGDLAKECKHEETAYAGPSAYAEDLGHRSRAEAKEPLAHDTRSEIELQSELNVSWILRTIDQPHVRSQSCRRSVQVHVVESVDEVSTELESHPFCHTEVLLQAKVNIGVP